MNAKSNWNRAAQLLVVFSMALALKQYYSTANVNQLRWILTPTTLIVELATGLSFDFESHAGYMSSDRTFVIAASCAGVNFLITAFLMLSLGKLWCDHGVSASDRTRSILASWKFIPAAAGVAFVATILANTVRIATALHLRQSPLEIAGLSGNQLHRLQGIFIYFGFLFLLFVMAEKITRRNATAGVSADSGRRFRVLRNCSFPLVIYYATALGIPLVNVIYRNGNTPEDFWEHSGFVLLAPLLIILPIATWQLLSSRRRKLNSRSASYGTAGALARQTTQKRITISTTLRV